MDTDTLIIKFYKEGKKANEIQTILKKDYNISLIIQAIDNIIKTKMKKEQKNMTLFNIGKKN